MFIDTHCHLNFKAFKKDLNDVIKHADEKGVGKIIIPGARLDSSEKAVKLAKDYSNCFAAVGIHPHHAKDYSFDLQQKLSALAKNERVVAIGEIGLDYHKYSNYPPVSDENKSLQRKLLAVQLDVARTLNLPVIFHSRNSQDDLLNFIEDFTKKTDHKFHGVFHCFEGTGDHLKKALALGFYVGFDGNITYEENSYLRILVEQTPLNKLLLETDSPFLTPMPFRGDRNTPANLVFVAEKVAELHKKSLNKIAEITSKNAANLFHL